MANLKSYLKAYVRTLKHAGLAYLIIAGVVVYREPIALYLMLASVIVALSGPIADSLNKKDSQ